MPVANAPASPASSAPKAPVHRFEVWPKAQIGDPHGASLAARAKALGEPVRQASIGKVYLIQAALNPGQLAKVQQALLTDPVTESLKVGVQPKASAEFETIEIHPLPGVMDPAAQSVRNAIRELVGIEAGVTTGRRIDWSGIDRERAHALTIRLLANPAVHAVHAAPFHPADLPRGKSYQFGLRHVPIRELTTDQLTKLSRDAHLFLSLDEMLAIQTEYKRLNREPTDIELETLAQTWSEHCVHKTLKSRVRYKHPGTDASRQQASAVSSHTGSDDPIAWNGRPGHTVESDGTIIIDNLLKSTVAAATFELMKDGADSWLLSVFKDNAGVIAFDDQHAVCVKVETHNHPSAIEPYGGSATGIGGCIRDVIGTGLAAKPIASTDVFCVAHPTIASLPPGTLHPRRILTDIVSGVRDYGNRMGIPTVSGGVFFDDRYVGNPLVFCGCIGVMPRNRIKGGAKPGDRIIALGGRTGRDGIHGATFSSTELEHTSADEFSHAVQIGNAIEEKRVLDVILRARDQESSPLFSGLTDCGAGGFSSAIGEMGGQIGANVTLEHAPLKYDGLSYTEIWISEAQERMVLAVPPENLAALQKICDEEHVELADLGEFGYEDQNGRPVITLNYHGHAVGQLDCEFLHEGIPQPTREAVWNAPKAQAQATTPNAGATPIRDASTIQSHLLALLGHPTIASKHWIIRQYDHEVQGNTAIKPLVGPGGRGPGDAAVIEPAFGTGRGLAISQGLQNGVGDPLVGGDPYLMVLASIDECVRNLVCVGADPDRIAILDNFCWPSCQRPENLGMLVRAAEGCYDGAKAYRTPFVSGKDSLNNQLRYTDPATGQERLIEIPPTLLITGIGIVPSIAQCVTMDAKKPGNILVLVGDTTADLAGSLIETITGPTAGARDVPRVDLRTGPATARAVHELIKHGLVASAHDCSEGGLLVALAEMLIATTGATSATNMGKHGSASGPAPLGLDLVAVPASILSTAENRHEPVYHEAAFSESPSRYVLEVSPGDLPKLQKMVADAARHAGVELTLTELGALTAHGRLRWLAASVDVTVEELAKTWLGPLDW